MECVPEVSEKNVDNLQEEDEKEENQHPVQKADSFFSILKDLLDLVVGGVLNVTSYFMSIFGGGVYEAELQRRSLKILEERSTKRLF